MNRTYYDIHGNPHERPDDAIPLWRVSVYGIAINEKNEVLAVRAKATKKWELPGGGVEIEEILEEALFREVFEETGYRAKKIDVDPKLIDSNFFRLSTQEYCHSVRAYFHIQLIGEQDKTIIDPDEVTEIGWLPINGLQESEWKDTAWQAMTSLVAKA